MISKKVREIYMELKTNVQEHSKLYNYLHNVLLV